MSIARSAGVDSSLYGRVWRYLSSPSAVVLSQLSVVCVVVLWASGADVAVVGPAARVTAICGMATSLMAAVAVFLGPASWSAAWHDALGRAGVLEQWPMPWFDAELTATGRSLLLTAEKRRAWRLSVTVLVLGIGMPGLVLLSLGITPAVGRLKAGPGIETETWEMTQPQELVHSLGARFEVTGPVTDDGLPVRVSDSGRTSANESRVLPLQRFRVGEHVLLWRAFWPSGEVGSVDVRVLDRSTREPLTESIRLPLNSPVSLGAERSLTLTGGGAESTIGTGPVASIRWTSGDETGSTLVHLRSPALDADFGTGPYVLQPTAFYPATNAEFRVTTNGLFAMNARPFLLVWSALTALIAVWWWFSATLHVYGRDGDRVLAIAGCTQKVRRFALHGLSRAVLNQQQREEWEELTRRLALPAPLNAQTLKPFDWAVPATVGLLVLGLAQVPATAVGAGVILSGIGNAHWLGALISGLVVAGSGLVVHEPQQWSSPHSLWLLVGLALSSASTFKSWWELSEASHRALVVSGASVGLVSWLMAHPFALPDSVFPGWAMVAWANPDGSLQTGALAVQGSSPIWLLTAALPFLGIVACAGSGRSPRFAVVSTSLAVILLGGLLFVASRGAVSEDDLRASLSAARALAEAGPFNATTVESAAHAAFGSSTAAIASLTLLLLLTMKMPSVGATETPTFVCNRASLWTDAGLMVSGALLLQVYCWSALEIDGPIFAASLVFAAVAALRGCLALANRQTRWGLVAQGILVSPMLVAIIMPSLRLSW